ncbi:hypothetical protein [Bacteroides uniformis]|uniref:hypothetical protein n=1 Tax=Bacteroides uniformis TaxID=820 RepID=UPI0021658449|nr:hypothetical protein [Bacteroides uniformis]MCS2412342.1 hypothetical protein [Bacteroides uniformis]
MEPVFLFLTCSGLSFAMIAQGLAKKIPERSEDDFFSSNRPEGLPCAIKGKRLSLQVRSGNTIFLIKEELPRWEQDSFMWW